MTVIEDLSALLHLAVRPNALFRQVILIALALVPTMGATGPDALQKGHTRDIIEVVWSADSTRLLSYSGGDMEMRVWNVPDARMLWCAKTGPPENNVAGAPAPTVFAWAPDGRSIAIGWSTGLVQLRDAGDGHLEAISHVRGEITALAFGSDSAMLSVAAEEKHGRSGLEILSLERGALRTEVRHTANGRIVAIDFRELRGPVLAGTLDGTVLRWSGHSATAEQRKLSICSTAPESDASVAYSFTGNRVAVRCGTTTKVLSLDTGSVIYSRPSEPYEKAVKFSANGKLLAIEESDIAIVDLVSSTVHTVESRSRTATTFDLSRDGSLLAEGGSYGDPGVFIASPVTGEVVQVLQGHPGIVYSLACSSSFASCAVAGGDGSLRLINPHDGSQIAVLGHNAKPLKSVRYGNSGRLLVSGSENGTATVWDSASQRQLFRLGDPGRDAVTTAINPREDHIATVGGSADNGIHIWRANDGGLIRALRVSDTCGLPPNVAPCTVKPSSIEFASNDLLLANAGNGRLYEVRVDTGGVDRAAVDIGMRPLMAANSSLAVFAGGREPALVLDLSSKQVRRILGKESQYSTAVAVTADGQTVATGNIVGKVVVWNAVTGGIIRQYKCDREIQGLAFSPDGRILLAGGGDQTVHAWDLPRDRLLYDLLAGKQ